MSPKPKATKPRKAKTHAGRGAFKKEKEIVIHGNSGITVRPDPLHLSRSGSEQAKWKHENGNTFFAQFQGESPFTKHIFFPGKEHSGKIVYAGPVPREFKYQVGVDGYALDPRVIIDP